MRRVLRFGVILAAGAVFLFGDVDVASAQPNCWQCVLGVCTDDPYDGCWRCDHDQFGNCFVWECWGCILEKGPIPGQMLSAWETEDGREILEGVDGSTWLQVSAGQWARVTEDDETEHLFDRRTCDGKLVERIWAKPVHLDHALASTDDGG